MPGSWSPFANPLGVSAGTMLLATDGSVFVHGANTNQWFRLAPDNFGNYASGTWTTLAPMHQARLYYASAILTDGRLFVAGGEYDGGINPADLNTAEVYDPLTDTWTVLPLLGWPRIGDAPCAVLADGRVLIGSIDDTNSAIFDPATMTWSAAGAGGAKDDRSSEETWTLLPDNTVLTAECDKHPQSEKYVSAQDRWMSIGAMPVDLVLNQPPVGEIGPAVLRTDGTVFAIGATGHTAIYTPPAVPTLPGTWTAGPDFPSAGGGLMEAKDAPAALVANGNVLCIVGPHSLNAGDYPGPATIFEYDGVSLTNTGEVINVPPYQCVMLLLPNRQVLMSTQTGEMRIYTPIGDPNNAWRPVITYVDYGMIPGQTYTLYGRQLNGLSQACSYGDDASVATNYPLVRLRDPATGAIHYCRTSNHSTMAVATGAAVHSTRFQVPAGVPPGIYEIYVVANSIESTPLMVEVGKDKAMGMAKLNIWVTGTDDPCSVDNRTWYVNIYDCHGRILTWCGRRYGVLKAPCGHLDIEVPPGCYRINAVWSFRTQGGAFYGNHFTDNAVVCACCDEHVCVHLFNPSVHRCGLIFTRAVLDLAEQKLVPAALVERTQAAIQEVLKAAAAKTTFATADDLDPAALEEMKKQVLAQEDKQ